MPYVKRVHDCKTPGSISIWLSRADQESIWQCPICSAAWILKRGYRQAWVWHRQVELEPEPITPRRRFR